MEINFQRLNINPVQLEMMQKINETFMRNLNSRPNVKIQPIRTKPLNHIKWQCGTCGAVDNYLFGNVCHCSVCGDSE